jgi:hypothetical protein
VSEEKLKLAKEDSTKILDHLKPEKPLKESDITGKGEET